MGRGKVGSSLHRSTWPGQASVSCHPSRQASGCDAFGVLVRLSRQVLVMDLQPLEAQPLECITAGCDGRIRRWCGQAQGM